MLQVRQLRDDAASASVPPPLSPADVALSDFTFIIEVQFVRWVSPPMAADREQKRRYYGNCEVWMGTFLSEANLGERAEDGAPTFGLLQLGDAECTMSVYATAPFTTTAAGQPPNSNLPRTFKLYHEGKSEGGDEDGSEPYDMFETKPLPYAHYGLAPHELDDFGLKFSIAPHSYDGAVALNLRYDDRLYEPELSQYLRGEPMPSFFADGIGNSTE